MVMPGISRCLISPCLMVILLVSLSILRTSPSVMEAAAVDDLAASAATCAMVETGSSAAIASSTVAIVVLVFFINAPCSVGWHSNPGFTSWRP
ncbi:hypothetical protein D3C71_1687310 [compost metagenome]